VGKDLPWPSRQDIVHHLVSLFEVPELHHAYISLDGQVINNEPITTTTTPTENAECSAISIINLSTIEDQQRQYSENARSVEQSRHSDLHTAFEGNRQISLALYPGDVEQTHHGRSRSVDESLPSYGLSNLFSEPCDEMSYCFLQNSSPQITS
jgi:hypothetical protein